MDPAQMNLHLNKSMTLMEVIIALVLMSLIILSFTCIYLFSHYQVFTADRRADAQNEASLVLEHMTKNLVRAIGNPAQNPVTLQDAGGVWRRIRIRIDSSAPFGMQNAADIERAYQWDSGTSRVRYWPTCVVGFGGGCIGAGEVISQNITRCVWSIDWATLGNNIRVDVTACSDPDNNPYPCGTPNNPNVDITTTIKMPSVSAN